MPASTYPFPFVRSATPPVVAALSLDTPTERRAFAESSRALIGRRVAMDDIFEVETAPSSSTLECAGWAWPSRHPNL